MQIPPNIGLTDHPESRSMEPSLDQIEVRLGCHLARLSSVCDNLEKIADDLPDAFNRTQCLLISRNIHPIVVEAHQFEESVLFPNIRKKLETDPTLEPMLNRLHWEHMEDESYSAEIAEALQDLVAGKLHNIEKLAYMLRGFFEGMRRHIAFEREHVLPLLARA